MPSLILKSNVIILFSVLLVSCVTSQNSQTSFFTVKRELNGAVEIVVTPDRVVLECEDTEEDASEEDRYLFMVQILDEENTVTTSMLGIRPDKRGCEIISKKVSRILKKARKLYIASRGSLTDDPRVEDRKLPNTFPGQGTFYSNGRVLQFALITNDKGECYNPMARDSEPCMEYPFPIEKHEKKLMKK